MHRARLLDRQPERVRSSLLWAALALGLLCACSGDDETDGRFDNTGPITGVGGQGAGGGTGLSGAAGGTGGTGGTGATGGTGGTGGCSYEAPNSCLGADTIQEIAGDDGGDLRVVTGRTSKYLKVFVAETVGSMVSFPPLKFTARLDNSPGMDFDLHVYGPGDEPRCEGDPTIATSDPAVVQSTWGDSLNSDDGRWFVFAVRYQSGNDCGSAAEWTFTLAGNYAPSCDTDGTCDGSDDCVCPDCVQDAQCTDPSNCSDDGECDTDDEGCVCADCSPTPYCL